MKSLRIAALALIASSLATPAFSNDAVRIYGRILADAANVQQKFAMASSMATLNAPEAAPYFADALDWVLASRSTIKPGPERETYERFSQLLLKSLGDWRYTNAAPSVMRALEDSPDALTKAEALMALGSMRAVEYAERIALMLRDLNERMTTTDADSGEKIAYGCVIALERMHVPAGFAPLFFASEGWYSRRVRDQATRSLALVLQDPSDAIAAIIAVETPARMIRAFELEMRSAAPDAGKTRIATLALTRGIAYAPRNRAEQNQLSELRIKAMNALAAAGPGDGSLAANLAEAYKIGPIDERLVALKAMGADKSAASATALSAILLELNDAQLAGIVDDTRNMLMKAALQNAAINASAELGPAIQVVLINSGWSGSIILLARDAQKAIQR